MMDFLIKCLFLSVIGIVVVIYAAYSIWNSVVAFVYTGEVSNIGLILPALGLTIYMLIYRFSGYERELHTQ